MKAKRFVFFFVILVLIIAVLWLLNDKFKVISFGGPKTPGYHYTIGEFKKKIWESSIERQGKPFILE